MKVLAIETSCDETAAAVIKDGQEILSNVIFSQSVIHAQYGGVVPEVAARSHIEEIIPVVEEALKRANTGWDDIDAIAVTKGPGLIGSLLIGVLTATTLSKIKKKPLIGVNHIWSHAFASFLSKNIPSFPILALTVSGGHTTLAIYNSDLTRNLIGETLDDAAGEAFDKVANLIGLPYPGGPSISKCAEGGNAEKYKFPIANLGKNSFDFSFSGLKTAVLRQVMDIVGADKNNPMKRYELDEQTTADIAASFQKAVVKALVKQAQKAYLQYKPASVVVGGGVASNNLLREEVSKVIPGVIFVPPILCTDNAAMIGALGSKMLERGIKDNPLELEAEPSLDRL